MAATDPSTAKSRKPGAARIEAVSSGWPSDEAGSEAVNLKLRTTPSVTAAMADSLRKDPQAKG